MISLLNFSVGAVLLRGSWPGMHWNFLNTSTVGFKDGGISNCETALFMEIILATPLHRNAGLHACFGELVSHS